MRPVDASTRRSRFVGRRRTAAVTLAVGSAGVVAAAGLSAGFAHQQAAANEAKALGTTGSDDVVPGPALPLATTAPTTSTPQHRAAPAPTKTKKATPKAQSKVVAPQPVYSPPPQPPAPAPVAQQPQAPSGGS